MCVWGGGGGGGQHREKAGLFLFYKVQCLCSHLPLPVDLNNSQRRNSDLIPIPCNKLSHFNKYHSDISYEQTCTCKFSAVILDPDFRLRYFCTSIEVESSLAKLTSS